MTDIYEFSARRFGVFREQVLEPAVFVQRMPLEAAVYQCADPITVGEAEAAAFTAVSSGWRWGPVWSTAWFRLTGAAPKAVPGLRVALRFCCGTEALVWHDGQPLHGLDDNRDTVLLPDKVIRDGAVSVLIEAACNRPLGASTFWWDEREMHRRWQEERPGRLSLCELALFDPQVWRLSRAFEFGHKLLLELPAESARAGRLHDAMRRVVCMVDDADVSGAAADALAVLEATLEGEGGTETRCTAVGHAHIDTAWLWPIRETRRKCVRTFSTALALIERFPEFTFLCSQPQQYAYIEEDAPGLFERVTNAVRGGRWEKGGAMWVEPDCNLPSGESFVRQVMHGMQYWSSLPGPDMPRYLYLPDTFGFSAALPQIARLTGLDTFLTNKMAWNDTNAFPHTSFIWRGLDGSEILAHCMPGHDYNATMTPNELIRGACKAARSDRDRADLWLQPFGFGDGGGGPADWSVEFARLSETCEGLPRVQFGRVQDFCGQLRDKEIADRTEGRAWPVWDGELYLEYHRGTYTTQAWLKKANRRGEGRLRIAEWLASAAPDPVTGEEINAARSRLDEAWKILLLHQFHDILPGSSIREVYEDAREAFARFDELVEGVIEEASGRWAAGLDTKHLKRPVLVFNPTSEEQGGLVEVEGEQYAVEPVPALGMRVVDLAESPAVGPVGVQDLTLQNDHLEMTLNEFGQIVYLGRVGVSDARNACRTAADGQQEPINQLVLYEDRPRAWDAWDIDHDYVDKAEPVSGRPDRLQVMEDGPLRAVIEVERALGRRSRIVQRYILAAGTPRLDIHTTVEWQEDHRLLRALFPVVIRSRWATYDHAFGCVQRPTHRNSPWDRAAFEVPAHRWMDLSEPGFGVALLNDCKYGHSCHDSTMGLTLLRSPSFPDELADRGYHEFTYALMVHDGDWRAAGVDQAAAVLNTPLWGRPLPGGGEGQPLGSWAPFTNTVSGSARVCVSALKPAESGDAVILRLVETGGGRGQVRIAWRLAVGDVVSVDLLERPMELPGLAHDAQASTTTMPIRPFQIVTLAARREVR